LCSLCRSSTNIQDPNSLRQQHEQDPTSNSNSNRQDPNSKSRDACCWRAVRPLGIPVPAQGEKIRRGNWVAT
jgi:hypothetical protein